MRSTWLIESSKSHDLHDSSNHLRVMIYMTHRRYVKICAWLVTRTWLIEHVSRSLRDSWLVHASVRSTNGGDRTKNYGCQNFQHIFTRGPVHIKQVLTGVSKFQTSFCWVNRVSVTRKIYQEKWSISRSKCFKSDFLRERIHEMYSSLRWVM